MCGTAFITTVSHMAIGLLYLGLGVIFGVMGTLLSNLVRLEAALPGAVVMEGANLASYNLVITAHGLVMVFWFIMPTLFGGFGNILLPRTLGVSDVSYPRFNNISLLLLPLSLVAVAGGLVSDYISGAGWTLYAPLSVTGSTLSFLGLLMAITGLVIVGYSSTLTSFNFLLTAGVQRVSGLGWSSVSLLVVSLVITGVLLLLVLPVLLCLLIFTSSDVCLNTAFFDPLFGGDPLFFQHLFWIFGHPEVYIIILPAFGLVSVCLEGLIQASAYGALSMTLAMGCIAWLGSCVWAHHMFAAGMSADTRAYFTAVTIMISLPTGTKVFNWLNTYTQSRGGKVGARSSITVAILLFVVLFTLGGGTGVVLGNGSLTCLLHDTYYVIAHFHYVLSLGAALGLLVGILFLDTLFGGVLKGLSLGRAAGFVVYLLVVLVGVLLVFTGLHSGLVRRITEQQLGGGFITSVASVGSTVVVLAHVVVALVS